MTKETTPIQKDFSPRVARTRQRIAQAAARVFAEHGYSGATTRHIAAAAGVSELTLFRHFGSKKNLFMQVVQHGSALPGMQAALRERMSGDLRQDLQIIGAHFLKTILERRKTILMTLSEAGRLPELRQAARQVPDHQRQMLAGYLNGHIQAGRLHPADPTLLAQAFLGMLFAYAINSALQEETPLDDAEIEQVVAFFVGIFLDGAAP